MGANGQPYRPIANRITWTNSKQRAQMHNPLCQSDKTSAIVDALGLTAATKL